MVSLIQALTGGTMIGLGMIHVYWASGGSLGKAAAIPQRGQEGAFRPLFRPSTGMTTMVACGLFAASAVVFSAWLPGHVILAALFGLRAIGEFNRVGFFKQIRGTRFANWDTWLYSPLCLTLAFGCLGSLPE